MHFVVYMALIFCYNNPVQQKNAKNKNNMLTRVKEMVDAFHAHSNASAGFTAKEVYEVGQTYGLTCREIYNNFLRKNNAIGYGRYLPQMLPTEVLEAALKAGPTKRGRKPGTAKKVVAKKVTKTIEAVEETPQVDSPSADGEVFCWIATPQELAEVVEVEPAKKKKRNAKTSKEDIS